MDKETLELLEVWRDDIRIAYVAHYEAARFYGSSHLHLGVGLVILSTVSGSAVFKISETTPLWIQKTALILSVVVPVVAGIQTFLGHSRLAAEHKNAGDEHGILRREIDQLVSVGQVIHGGSSDEIAKTLEAVKAAENAIVKADREAIEAVRTAAAAAGTDAEDAAKAIAAAKIASAFEASKAVLAARAKIGVGADAVEEIRKKWDALTAKSPSIPDQFYRRAQFIVAWNKDEETDKKEKKKQAEGRNQADEKRPAGEIKPLENPVAPAP